MESDTETTFRHILSGTKKPYQSVKSCTDRFEKLVSILSDKSISEGKLRNLVSQGIPDHTGFRGAIEF